MNLIQTLPSPSLDNTRFTEVVLDFCDSFEVTAIYRARGLRFSVSERRSRLDAYRLLCFKKSWFMAEATILDEMRIVCLKKLRQAMTDHLAIINPIDNG